MNKKDALLYAAELIVNRKELFSCIAVMTAALKFNLEDGFEDEYANAVGVDCWAGFPMSDLSVKEQILARSLALLLFRELL